MEWDYRKILSGENPFTGILLQEYDPEKKRWWARAKKIFTGSPIGGTEGPHLYRHNGYYYLMCAEGGTGWFHAVTLARSRELTGPYEICPHNPVLTSWEGSRDPKEIEKALAKKDLGTSFLRKPVTRALWKGLTIAGSWLISAAEIFRECSTAPWDGRLRSRKWSGKKAG
ncbi:MAG: family 43 glycosylhydrolase [Lachnospiraceae bacterium]